MFPLKVFHHKTHEFESRELLELPGTCTDICVL